MKKDNVETINQEALNDYKDPDFTLENVPLTARKKWMPVFVVLLGFTFLSTSTQAGAGLGAAFKFSDLLMILMLGSLFLGLYAGVLCAIATRTGLNSVLQARYALGSVGGKWADLILGGTQVVWYAVQSAYLSDVFTRSLGIEEYFIPITIFFSLFTGAFAIWGTRGMEIVGYIAMPAFVYFAYIIPKLSIAEVGGMQNLLLIEPVLEMGFFVAVTTVIGTFVSGATNAANWGRFSKTPKQGFSAAFISFFIGTSIMVGCGMIGGLAIQVGDMVEILISYGIVFMGILVLVLNIWTTNTSTAYSFGVAAADFFEKPNKIPFVIAGLIIATIIAITGIFKYFMDFLILLGVFIPPLGGIFIGDYIYTWWRKMPKMNSIEFLKIRYSNWIAYILSIIIAYISNRMNFGVPSLNGVLSAIILVYVVNTIFKKMGIENEHHIKDNAEYVYNK